ncbi:MAG: hypothetical protein DHS20C06_20650 [Hyphobacterium sp.]|nr:MAG: hypothetical protein DHS20C06_20650 [Hyphobacterium sp.]
MNFYHLALIVSFAGLLASLAQASDTRPAAQGDLPDDAAGRVAIVCPADAVSRYVSRGIAIQHRGDSRFDIILAARHAAGDTTRPDFTACSVRGSGGILQPVTAARMAPSYAGRSDDWVVLRTRAALPPDLTRIGLAGWTFDDATLPRIALLATNPRFDCAIQTSQDYSIPTDTLFAHDCPSRPGLSGAPIVVMVDGELTAVGFHLGQLTELDMGGSRRIGIGRRIDAEITHAIVDLSRSPD